jgi:hypothetical protein
MKYQPATDYADEPATEIDREPHWSSLRQSLAQMTSRALPRAQTVRPELPAPRLPPRLPPAVQRSAANFTPSAPLPVVAPPEPVYMLPFYSHAESQAQYGLDTERVAPLPMSSIRPSWEELLVKTWQRFAAPICGGIAGLIFVVGYLAYSSQSGAAIASSATPVAPIVMPEIAMTAPVEDEAPVVSPAAIAQPTVAEVHVAKPAKATKRPAKRVASSGKRQRIRLNDATPLGDLRPSRSR